MVGTQGGLTPDLWFPDADLQQNHREPVKDADSRTPHWLTELQELLMLETTLEKYLYKANFQKGSFI